jgi:hypothetical protein
MTQAIDITEEKKSNIWTKKKKMTKNTQLKKII